MKNPFDSKTIWGLVALVVGFILKAFGIDADMSFVADGTVTWVELLTFIGALLTAIGIRVGEKPLSLAAPFSFFGLKKEEG